MATSTRGITSGQARARNWHWRRLWRRQGRLPAIRPGTSLLLALAFCFAVVGAQLVRLALIGQSETQSAMAAPVAGQFARPGIVDRNGQLLATDVVHLSLFADPHRIRNVDGTVDALASVLRDLDRAALARDLRDRDRRFVWVKRGLPPALVHRLRALALPGLAFRREQGRGYPSEALTTYVVGQTDIDNAGLSGIERHIDALGQAKPIVSAAVGDDAPQVLSLDLAVQFAVARELARAVADYQAAGAAGLILDVHTGEILAASSVGGATSDAPPVRDHLAASAYELGSIFKALTIAMSLDAGRVTPTTKIDVSGKLAVGGHEIEDHSGGVGQLTVAEIFLKSSNVGAGSLALAAGAGAQRKFLTRLGLGGPIATEAGAVADPLFPENWGDAETMTIGYGHGIAVAPLHFAAAAASLVNGGYRVRPTFLRAPSSAKSPAKSSANARGNASGSPKPRQRVLSDTTSRQMRSLFRRNVADRTGTGFRADVPGYRVGGKTGTAEIPTAGGYDKNAVIASFLGSFPMTNPRYLTLMILIKPRPTAANFRQTSAAWTAAPLTARVIERAAPLLGVPMAAEDLADR